MTLIVTFMSKDKVVQASDRRLTLNGKLYDDNSNKAVTVVCGDAYFAVAYTGLAEVQHKDTRRRTRTDRWIADSLWNLMQEGYYDLRSLFYAFAQYTEETYQKMRLPLTYQGTKFVFAGFFFRSKPLTFTGLMSNMVFNERGNFKVERKFHTDVRSFRLDVPDSDSTIAIDGAVMALRSTDAVAKSMWRQTQRIHEKMIKVKREGVVQDEGWVAQQLVQIIRMASRHPEYGKYINRDCMTVNIGPNGPGFGTFYYPGVKDSYMHYLPIMVVQDMVGQGEFELRPATTEEIKRSHTKDDAT